MANPRILKEVKIQLVSMDAKMPTQAYEQAAGFDLYANLGGENETIIINPNMTAKIPLGIKTSFPPGFVGLIYARSGLAANKGIAPANKVGVVDADYRGEWILAAHNHSAVPAVIRHGDKVCQAVFQKIETPKLVRVTDLDDTARGEGGFNSSGTR